MSTKRAERPAVEPGWVWDEVSDLDYAHAAHVLRLPDSWLREKVPELNLPHSEYGRHVRFTPDDIAEIRRMHHKPETNAPLALARDGEAHNARLRAALVAADRRRAA